MELDSLLRARCPARREAWHVVILSARDMFDVAERLSMVAQQNLQTVFTTKSAEAPERRAETTTLLLITSCPSRCLRHRRPQSSRCRRQLLSASTLETELQAESRQVSGGYQGRRRTGRCRILCLSRWSGFGGSDRPTVRRNSVSAYCAAPYAELGHASPAPAQYARSGLLRPTPYYAFGASG